MSKYSNKKKKKVVFRRSFFQFKQKIYTPSKIFAKNLAAFYRFQKYITAKTYVGSWYSYHLRTICLNRITYIMQYSEKLEMYLRQNQIFAMYYNAFILNNASFYQHSPITFKNNFVTFYFKKPKRNFFGIFFTSTNFVFNLSAGVVRKILSLKKKNERRSVKVINCVIKFLIAEIKMRLLKRNYLPTIIKLQRPRRLHNRISQHFHHHRKHFCVSLFILYTQIRIDPTHKKRKLTDIKKYRRKQYSRKFFVNLIDNCSKWFFFAV